MEDETGDKDDEDEDSEFKTFRVFGPTIPYPAPPAQTILLSHWNFCTALSVRLPKNPVALVDERYPAPASNDCRSSTCAVRRPKYNDCVKEAIPAAVLDEMAAIELDDDGAATTTDAAVGTGTMAVIGDEVGETAPVTSVAATKYACMPGATP